MSIFSRFEIPKGVLSDVVSEVILIVVQYVSICMFSIQLVMSLYQIMCGIMHSRYVGSDESQRKSQLQVYSTSVVDDSSEMLHENYEGLVESPSSSDDGEIDINISLDMTEEQQSEVSSVANFVSEDFQDEVYQESLFAGDRKVSIACNINID